MTKISIIVPAFNSEKLLKNFFESLILSQFKDFEVIINDDLRSDDETESLINDYIKRKLKILYMKKNKSMAQGRRYASKYANGDILIHLDTDMEVPPDLIGECYDKISSMIYDALVIPEESFGSTFWAKCKFIEKRCYMGEERIEALRVMKKSIYRKVGGHNPDMIFSEDKDLDIRVRALGAKVGYTKNVLRHNEGALKLSRTLRKKLFYTETADLFASTHPEIYKWRRNPFNRYLLFLKNIKYLFSDPLHYFGLWLMVTIEFGVSGIKYALLKLQRHKGVS